MEEMEEKVGCRAKGCAPEELKKWANKSDLISNTQLVHWSAPLPGLNFCDFVSGPNRSIFFAVLFRITAGIPMLRLHHSGFMRGFRVRTSWVGENSTISSDMCGLDGMVKDEHSCTMETIAFTRSFPVPMHASHYVFRTHLIAVLPNGTELATPAHLREWYCVPSGSLGKVEEGSLTPAQKPISIDPHLQRGGCIEEGGSRVPCFRPECNPQFCTGSYMSERPVTPLPALFAVAQPEAMPQAAETITTPSGVDCSNGLCRFTHVCYDRVSSSLHYYRAKSSPAPPLTYSDRHGKPRSILGTGGGGDGIILPTDNLTRHAPRVAGTTAYTRTGCIALFSALMALLFGFLTSNAVHAGFLLTLVIGSMS